MAYFTGWVTLLHGLATNPLAWDGALFVMAFVAGAILFDFGWLRDQMPTMASPERPPAERPGRPRHDSGGIRREARDPKVKLKDHLVGVLAGDCSIYRACVNACPTGTDIRRGLQPECIGTAQCINTCEEVMLAQGKPIGLIKDTRKGRSRAASGISGASGTSPTSR